MLQNYSSPSLSRFVLYLIEDERRRDRIAILRQRTEWFLNESSLANDVSLSILLILAGRLFRDKGKRALSHVLSTYAL